MLIHECGKIPITMKIGDYYYDNGRKIARINELYHKSKETGLTEEEKEEQGRLRWDYINSIKAGIGAHLDNMSIKYPDGTIKKVKKANIIQDK